MVKKILKFVVLVIACWTFGFAIVTGIIKNHQQNVNSTKLNLVVKLLGVNNRPVANASISILTPSPMPIGKTDTQGVLKTNVMVPSGKVSVLQASGPNFRIQKDLLVPNASEYQLRILIEPQDFENGTVQLVSRDNISLFNPPSDDVGTAIKAPKTIWIGKEHYSNVTLKKSLKRLSEFLNAQKSYFAKNKILEIGFRPIWNQKMYVEILSYGMDKSIIGSVLLSNDELLTGNLSDFFAKSRPSVLQAAGASGKISIRSEERQNLRAYLNGAPLPRLTCGKICIFKLAVVPNFSDGNSQKTSNEFYSLAITGQNVPLILREIGARQLESEISWNLPRGMFSQKERPSKNPL